jgi:hypothetical protein
MDNDFGDIVLYEICKGVQNIYTDNLKKETVISNKYWNDDMFLYEERLENELLKYNNDLEKDQEEFENEINKYNESLNDDFITNCINNPEMELEMGLSFIDFHTKINDTNINNKIKEYKIFDKVINKCDYIKNIVLEIELNESFHNLTFEKKRNILETQITLSLCGNNVNIVNVLNCLFYDICTNKKISQNNNIIQFCIIDFSLYKTSNKIFYGLPILKTQNSDMRVRVSTDLKCKMNLIINGLLFDTQNKSDIIKYGNSFEFSFFQNQNTGEKQLKTSLNKIKLNFKHPTKYLLFYLLSIDKYNDDLFIDYPNIKNVKLKCNGMLVKEYDVYALLTFEIFEIKIYILPLSRDFSTFEQINESFNNLTQLTSQTVNFSSIDTAILILESENDLDNYVINVEAFSMNILRGTDNLVYLAYSA